MWTSLRAGFCKTALVAFAALALSGKPASAVTVPVDLTAVGVPQAVNVTGSGGGSMLFTLTLGPLASGSFAMDVFNIANGVIASLNIFDGSYTPGTGDLGNITIVPPETPPPSSGVFSLEFRDAITWQVDVAAGDLSPVELLITSFLSPSTPTAPFNPQLTVSFTGDLALETQTPLPGALPLFASGLGVLGLAHWRRRRRARAA